MKSALGTLADILPKKLEEKVAEVEQVEVSDPIESSSGTTDTSELVQSEVEG